MTSQHSPNQDSTTSYPLPPIKPNSHPDLVNSISSPSRLRRFLHSIHNHHHPTHRQHLHRQDLSPSPTVPEDDPGASQSILETRDIFHFHHTTPVKLDSQAGTTGTSVAQLPGRHFIVLPWLAMLVWLFILFFIGLTVAGFTLSYQARKEFRMRVEEQRKAQEQVEQEQALVTECKIPITTKEFKSFTRKSIMVLNSSSPRGRHQPNNSVYSIDKAGELRPRNMFDRPPRDSVLVAEITSSGNFSGDDPFYEFSRQMTREGLWDLAARKSKVISVVSLSSMMPKIGKRNSNRFTMMDLAQEELDEHNYQSNLQHNLDMPSNSRARRHLQAAEGANLRIEDHVVQPNRFVPPVPKLPLRFAHERADSGEKLSSFNDILFLPFNEDKQSSFMDPTISSSTRTYPPRRTASRRDQGSEDSETNDANPEPREIESLSLPQRSTSLRGKSERLDPWQKDAHSYEDDQNTKTLVRTNNPSIEVSPDDAFAQYASSRAAAAISPLPSSKPSAKVERDDLQLPCRSDGYGYEDQQATETLVRATTPYGDVSPDDAVAQYASARAAAMSPVPKLNYSGSSSRFIGPRSITPTPVFLDGRQSPAPSTQMGCIESIGELHVSPDDAVAQYASARAAAMSPLPNSKLSRASSKLGFIRRSTTPTPAGLDGRESPAPSTQMGYLESITEPLPMRSQEFLDSSPAHGSLSENGDEYCKPFSVIFEEDDDEDYFFPTSAQHNPTFTPISSSFRDTPSGRSPENNIPLPRRLPPATLGRSSSHTSRLRAHTVTSQGPTSVAMSATSSTSKTTSSSSFGSRSRSGSSGARAVENPLHRSLNYLSSPNTVPLALKPDVSRGSETSLRRSNPLSSPHEAPLTLKRIPSLSTNPYGRRRKQLEEPSLNQQEPTLPRRHIERHFSEREDRSIKQHPPHSSRPRGSTQDPDPADPSAPIRRAVSAQARIPLSGTMSSGGVRNSSFVP